MRGWWRPLVVLMACYGVLVTFFVAAYRAPLADTLVGCAGVVAFAGVLFFGLGGLGNARGLRLFLEGAQEGGAPVQVLRREILWWAGLFCEFRSIGGLVQVKVRPGLQFWPPGAPLPLSYVGTWRMMGRLAAQRLLEGPPEHLAAAAPGSVPVKPSQRGRR